MRAILSVSNKTDIDLLGRGLADLDVRLYATGGTRRALEAAGVPVHPVSALTHFPEILGGRVKTLHPAVFGGILARRDRPADCAELDLHGLKPFDLVAVNLYPFGATVARPDVTVDEALEQIDIGGPALLRAAAKNHTAVVPLCQPEDYRDVLAAWRGPGGPDTALRQRLAAKAFRHTAAYDALIAEFLGCEDAGWPAEQVIGMRGIRELRYGENPHQRAAFYALVQPGEGASGLAAAEQFQGKPLSYTNLLDMDAAWAIASAFPQVAVTIIKHTNPCGLACAGDALEAYDLALAGDPVAAFGGIVATNAPVGNALALRLIERFFEAILAPAFSQNALDTLSERPSLRVLALPPPPPPGLQWRSVSGGLLVQQYDAVSAAEVVQGQVVTRRSPTDEEWAALSFAWRAVRHVKSNAIVLAGVPQDRKGGPQVLLGMGAGQPSRLAAVEIAVQRAGPRAEGSVLASDAFFPKSDALRVATDAGVGAVVQPGGSRGDAEVIDAANAANMAMVLTRIRHFSH
jgi:phosphoribosylaminoimidazolecarboxamide formyltransferase/IMP cyclohydrolase